MGERKEMTRTIMLFEPRQIEHFWHPRWPSFIFRGVPGESV
jgi:hypothetical protein